ncbi:MAG: V-type ATP synthase subunit K [Erysipelotrichia bacterium]|nr:V-type ATP synthase subunit K [Erysipelotrichia bacterium]
MMTYGLVLSIIGAALAAGLGGIGSAIGVSIAGRAGNGVLAEKPDLFGRILVLQALPGTQGIYGFLLAVLILQKIGLLGGTAVALTDWQGWAFLGAALPIAIVGLLSGIAQGKVAATSILMTGKRPEMMTRGMTMTAIVETYAILALLVSILMYSAIAI